MQFEHTEYALSLESGKIAVREIFSSKDGFWANEWYITKECDQDKDSFVWEYGGDFYEKFDTDVEFFNRTGL